MRFGVTENQCLWRLRDPASDYCSLVDVALYRILAVMITTICSDAQYLSHTETHHSVPCPPPHQTEVGIQCLETTLPKVTEA